MYRVVDNTIIQNRLFSSPLRGNRFYFLVNKFVRFFTLFFLTDKMKAKKKLHSDTKIMHKDYTSKYLHLYLLTQRENHVS